MMPRHDYRQRLAGQAAVDAVDAHGPRRSPPIRAAVVNAAISSRQLFRFMLDMCRAYS